ncbi:MAG: radical SAM protein [Planctomycetales bacterium 4484_123]|nr:MAG: radical SAM protein [Planctomycetales bacterium 4484_123]
MDTDEQLAAAREMLAPCRVCPRRCGVDRLAGDGGFCRTGPRPRVASAGAHFGEEGVLVGAGGSGTIFFQCCNLDCVFCQNYDISHFPGGTEVSAEELAGLMTALARRGCSNINLVSPTHVAPQVLEAVVAARSKGLRLPVVYNCGGYEAVDMLALLDGHIDVYMPDFKYASAEAGRKYSGVPDYPAVAEAALAEMYRQVGPLELDDRGLAVRGVMVRHLVMPMDLAGGREVIDIVARVAPGAGMNVMGQYRPCYRADEFPELLRLPDPAEIARLRRWAAECGLRRLDRPGP